MPVHSIKDLNSFSDRDRQAIERALQKVSDLRIIQGLLNMDFTPESIAKKMGAPVGQVKFYIQRFKLEKQTENSTDRNES